MRGTVFGVTYNYTGYPMVRQAREMVRAGELGEIRKVVVEYNQGWLATRLEAGGNKQAAMAGRPGAKRGRRGDRRHRFARREPAVHRHRPARWKASARTSTPSLPGRTLDDDANVLLRLSGGARGVLVASQINTGVENGFRMRVSGTQGSLEWWQEEPNRLLHSPAGGPAAAAHARLAVAVRGGAAAPAAFRPATRRVSSRRLPMSTLGSQRRSALMAAVARPTRWQPTIPTFTKARVACVSSRRSWRRRPAI